MEEPTRIELVIAVLQTAPLATWVRLLGWVGAAHRQEKEGFSARDEEGRSPRARPLRTYDRPSLRAGDETRTRDIQLGKLAFYH